MGHCQKIPRSGLIPQMDCVGLSIRTSHPHSRQT
jgi:hypothetical protein